MAHLEGGFHQLSQRLAGIDLRFDSVERRFDSVDRRLDAIDRRFESVDRSFDTMGNKFESLRSEVIDKIDQRFMWTIAAVLASWLSTMLGILAVFFRH